MEDVIRLFADIRDIGRGEGLKHFLLKIYGLLFLRGLGFRMIVFEPEIFDFRPDILAIRVVKDGVEVAWLECGKMHKPYSKVKEVLDKLKTVLSGKLNVRYRIFDVNTKQANLPSYVEAVWVSEYAIKLLYEVYNMASRSDYEIQE